MAGGKVFHWRHGWIPILGSDMSPEDKLKAQRARLADSRAKNASSDAEKRKRLAESRARNAARDAAKRARYHAALNRKIAKHPSPSDVPPVSH